MHPTPAVRAVFRLVESGLSTSAIAWQTGIPRATVRDWRVLGEEELVARRSRRKLLEQTAGCRDECVLTAGADERDYAYLLGQYLGDGCVSPAGGNLRLRIACCDAYPDIMEECGRAIVGVVPGTRVGRMQRVGCTEVYAQSHHWACLLPHGPGRKHERPVRLRPWQRWIALDRRPDAFVRGLIHSDGCRAINTVRAPNGQTYSYPRYQFSNRSADIRELFCEVCTILGVEWRRMNRWNISVARRKSVAILDRYVGPKS